jgi:hypothetical protein
MFAFTYIIILLLRDMYIKNANLFSALFRNRFRFCRRLRLRCRRRFRFRHRFRLRRRW